MMYQTAGGDGGILIYLVGVAIVLINWIIKSRSAKNAGEESTPEEDAEWQPLERPRSADNLPPPPLPVPPGERPGFRRHQESQPPRREPSIAHPGAVHPKAARSPQPVAVPPTLARRGTVAPHSLREQMAEKDEVAAAGPLRSAGESPGSLRTHVDEWMGQDLPEFKTMQVPGRPPPNRLADAPPPPTVSLPAAVLAKRAPRQLATLALVASRGRHPYHLTFNPRTMRQAVVLTEVLGRPRGYDL